MESTANQDRLFGNPERYSLLWNVLLHTVLRPWLHVWYKRITITGRENIPQGKPVIFAPNHQNGIIDPLLVLAASRRQIVWLATADYFKNKLLAKILRRFRVVPVHRMKDGSDVLGDNRLVFMKCYEVLQRNHELGLFPEGAYWGYQRLRPAQKTISRIAFLSEELSNFELDVQIVPVGITYSHYYHFHHNVLVQFGKPISVKEYKNSYRENSEKADLELRQTLEAALLELMIHIPSEEYYTEIRQLLLTCDHHFMRQMGASRKHLIRKFVSHKQLTDVLLKHITLAPHDAEALFKKTKEYRLLLADLQMHDSMLDKSHNSWLTALYLIGLLPLFPLFLVGFLINILPFYVPYRAFISAHRHDRQMISSFMIPSALVIFTLWYSLIALVVFLLGGGLLGAAVAVVASGISGAGAFHWRRSFLRSFQRLRLRKLKSDDRSTYNALFSLRKSLIAETMQIFEQHKGAWGKNKRKNM